MPIRIKFFLAFSVLVGLACALAFFGIRGIAASGDLVLRLNDGPLTGINHARLAQAKLNEARLLIAANPGNDVRVETELKFGAIVTAIAEDLSVVRERIKNDDVRAALAVAEERFRDWSQAAYEFLSERPDGLAMPPAGSPIRRKSSDAATALDNLADRVAVYGFSYRMEAEARVADARATLLALTIGTCFVGIMLAVGFSYSMGRPILEAMQVAERVAAGNLSDVIGSSRHDELGRLLRRPGPTQTAP